MVVEELSSIGAHLNEYLNVEDQTKVSQLLWDRCIGSSLADGGGHKRKRVADTF